MEYENILTVQKAFQTILMSIITYQKTPNHQTLLQIFLPKMKPTCLSVIYIIGDNYSNKQFLMQFLLGSTYNQSLNDTSHNCLSIYYSSVLGTDKLIEVYEFPTDRFVRQYLDVYFELLPKPNLILYCTELESSQKEIQEWIQMIEDEDQYIVFVSDISTLAEKTQLIEKISCFFQKDVVDYIYLPNFETSSLYSCICNLNNGMSLKNYVRKVNTWSSIKIFFKRLSSFLRGKQPSSIV